MLSDGSASGKSFLVDHSDPERSWSTTQHHGPAGARETPLDHLDPAWSTSCNHTRKIVVHAGSRWTRGTTGTMELSGGPGALWSHFCILLMRALVDFSMMAQYRSHTSDIIAYMEDYLDQFSKMKGIFLKFLVTKRTLAKVDEQWPEIRHERTQMSQARAPTKRRPSVKATAKKRISDVYLIHCESHFNFIKIHLLRHLSDHIRKFGNIPIYSTEFGELAQKEQIKDRWRRSNKNDPGRQMVHSYECQHTIRMV